MLCSCSRLILQSYHLQGVRCKAAAACNALFSWTCMLATVQKGLLCKEHCC